MSFRTTTFYFVIVRWQDNAVTLSHSIQEFFSPANNLLPLLKSSCCSFPQNHLTSSLSNLYKGAKRVLWPDRNIRSSSLAQWKLVTPSHWMALTLSNACCTPLWLNTSIETVVCCNHICLFLSIYAHPMKHIVKVAQMFLLCFSDHQ